MKAENVIMITDGRAVLHRTMLGEAQANPLAAAFLAWLLRSVELERLLEVAAAKAAAERGAERSSRNVAVLGFACGIESLKPRFAGEFSQQLEWSMGRPNFASGGEPCGAVADPLILAGMCAGAEAVMGREERGRFELWAAGVRKDAEGLVQDGGWRRGLLRLVGKRLNLVGGQLPEEGTGEPVWLAAGLQRREWGAPAETAVGDVLKLAVEGAAGVTDGFEAGLRLAAIEWAATRAMDFDVTALTIKDIAGVLERVPAVFQRWTWEDKPRTSRQGAEARRWHIENEYHFQSLLYTVLKPLIPALEEEQYLPPTGTYQPRADLCILPLELVIEVKFWYRGRSVKELTEEIAADLTLYLRKDSPYRKVIAVVWDDGARTEEQAELKRGLKGLTGLFDAVIVNRPSCMNDGEVPADAGKRRGRRGRSIGAGDG